MDSEVDNREEDDIFADIQGVEAIYTGLIGENNYMELLKEEISNTAVDGGVKLEDLPLLQQERDTTEEANLPLGMADILADTGSATCIRKKRKTRKHKRSEEKQCDGCEPPSKRKRKRRAAHEKGNGSQIVHKTLTTEGDNENDNSSAVGPLHGVAITNNKTWDYYCTLPTLPTSSMRIRKDKQQYIVSLEKKMVYSGPLSKRQSRMLSFKADVLCNIVKDKHSPDFHVVENVLMYPLCNPELLAKWDNGELYELFQPTHLNNQSIGLLGTQPVSILEHCMARYILDIGETGISYLMLHGKTQTFVNTHLNKSWGSGKQKCQDNIVQFFQSRWLPESRMLVLKSMVLQNRASLLRYLAELDIAAIKQAAERHVIPKHFVKGMGDRVQLIRSALYALQDNHLV